MQVTFLSHARLKAYPERVIESMKGKRGDPSVKRVSHLYSGVGLIKSAAICSVATQLLSQIQTFSDKLLSSTELNTTIKESVCCFETWTIF